VIFDKLEHFNPHIYPKLNKYANGLQPFVKESRVRPDSRDPKSALTPTPLPSQKALRERGEFFTISRRKFRTLPSPGALFARGEG